MHIHGLAAFCAAMQEPKVRPTAKFLMQHKFVAQVPQGVPAALQPLIQRSQDLIIAAAMAEQANTLGGTISRCGSLN